MSGLIAFLVTIALGAVLIRAALPGEPGNAKEPREGGPNDE